MHKDDKYQIQTTQRWLLEGVITMGSDAQDITWTFCMLKNISYVYINEKLFGGVKGDNLYLEFCFWAAQPKAIVEWTS